MLHYDGHIECNGYYGIPRGQGVYMAWKLLLSLLLYFYSSFFSFFVMAETRKSSAWKT